MPKVIKLLFPCLLLLAVASAPALAEGIKDSIYNVGDLKPVDSQLKVRVGDPMPDFSLASVGGGKVSLTDFKGEKNIVISFVPAAWTPVCSDQWPGYNIARELFEDNQAALLGVSVDNIPTLYSWTKAMGGLWFPVLSDFWPHGGLADRLGILRSDGVSERAIFIVGKDGLIKYIDVHDINKRPELGTIIQELQKLR